MLFGRSIYHLKFASQISLFICQVLCISYIVVLRVIQLYHYSAHLPAGELGILDCVRDFVRPSTYSRRTERNLIEEEYYPVV